MTETLAALVSEPRLRKYRAVCDDESVLVDLYAMDMKLSASAFKARRWTPLESSRGAS